jgi:tetratricopeptide (TPR) repeat protein
LTIGQDLGLSTIIQFVSYNLVLAVYRPGGEHEAALSFLDTLINDTLYLEHDFLTGALYWNHAEILAFLGLYQESVESMTRSRNMAKDAGASAITIGSTLKIACGLANCGEYKAAREQLNSANLLIDESGLRQQIAPPWQIYISRCYYLLDDEEGMLRELKSLVESLKQLDSGTSLDDLADADILLAQIHFRLFETLGSKEHLQDAMAYSRKAIEVSQRDTSASEIERYSFTLYRCLAALGEQAEADEYLEKAYNRVMLVAGKTNDSALRKSWLENVAINREILKEAGKRGIGE